MSMPGKLNHINTLNTIRASNLNSVLVPSVNGKRRLNAVFLDPGPLPLPCTIQLFFDNENLSPSLKVKFILYIKQYELSQLHTVALNVAENSLKSAIVE